MKIYHTTALLFAISTSTVLAADCDTETFASCGSDNGTSCCPDGYYCQPWNPSFYQCVLPPSQCPEQLTNIDFYGDDLETLYGLQPSECCSACADTAGCVAYTFVNSNPGQPACYLKSGTGDPRSSAGAVSGIVGSAGNTSTSAPALSNTTEMVMPPPSPANDCLTSAGASCGDSSGTTCCPGNQYCMPWALESYQCIDQPAQCSRQETDVDYNGADLKTVYVNLPSLCCDACASTEGCTAYTYVNANEAQSACYLKNSTGTPMPSIGTVSGQLN